MIVPFLLARAQLVRRYCLQSNWRWVATDFFVEERMRSRIRAGTVVGSLWGVAWAIGGVALATWRVFFLSPRLATPLTYWPRFAITGALALGIIGAIAGALFATALAKQRIGSTVDDLSASRALRWGAGAGLVPVVVLPALGLTALPALALATAFSAAVGAATAAATVSIARSSRRTLPATTLPPALKR